MSLLSGIRYVPKSERPAGDERKDSDKHHHHKHKHKHHKHKHHKHKHRSKDKDNDKEKKEKHHHHHHDSDGSDDSHKDVDLEADRQLMMQFMGSDEHHPQKKMRIDGHRSYSLSPSPSRSPSPIREDRHHQSLRRDSSPVDHIHTTSTTQDTPSNTSMAALLRARLKKGGPVSSSTVVASPSSSSSIISRSTNAPDISFMTTGELKWMSDYTRKTKEGAAEQTAEPTGDDMSIQRMFAAEKFGGGVLGASTDMDGVIASNIIRKGSNFKGTELGLGSSISRGGSGLGGDRAGGDEGDELGDGELDMKMLQAKEDRLKDADIAKRIMERAQASGRAYMQIVENCARCRGGFKHYKPHRTIAAGQHIELRIKPVSNSLDPPWHCELIPLVHTPSILRGINSDADGENGEGIARELDRFKSCLVSMFEQSGRGVAFLETALHAGGSGSGEGGRISKHHTVVDVIPFERGLEADIEMFFKQAFMSAGEEWSTHKKLISINAHNSLRKAVPGRFPYICAEWSTSGRSGDSGDESRGLQGLAHLVEDSQKYKNSFCLDVIAGALDVDPFILRKMARGGDGHQNSSNTAEDERKEKDFVRQFKNAWTAFDWTQYLSFIAQE